MGGGTPSTFVDGILSGVGHPIIGPDHLAFLVALGIAVGVCRLSLVTPFLFLLAMSCGVAAMWLRQHSTCGVDRCDYGFAAGVLIALDWSIPSGAWAASSASLASFMVMPTASQFTALNLRRLLRTWLGLWRSKRSLWLALRLRAVRFGR